MDFKEIDEFLLNSAKYTQEERELVMGALWDFLHQDEEFSCRECEKTIYGNGNGHLMIDNNFYCFDCYHKIYDVCDKCSIEIKKDEDDSVRTDKNELLCLACDSKRLAEIN